MYKRITVLILIVATVAYSSCSKCLHSEPEAKQLVLQSGDNTAEDCLVAYRESDGDYMANANHHLNPDITASRWTFYSDNDGEGSTRSYIKFHGLSDIPESAVIDSAYPSFYGVGSSITFPNGNSYYPGSPYESFGQNAGWMKRVLADWQESSITWNNKPATSEENKAAVPASVSQWNSDALNINVTAIVSDMVKLKQNFGFCLELQTEEIYRAIVFGGSEHPDATKRPKLVVFYTIKKGTADAY